MDASPDDAAVTTRAASGATSRPPRGSPWAAALAGLVAAGLALGVGELLTSLATGDRSLLVSVGQGVIDLSPEPTTRFGIETFGTADKPALLTGIVLISLALGAVTGIVSLRRRWVGTAVFGAFGLLGAWAGLHDPFVSAVPAVLAPLLAAAAGAGALALLLLLAGPATARSAALAGEAPGGGGNRAVAPIEDPTRPFASRRAFFGWSAGLGAFGALAALGGGVLRGRGVAERARDEITLPGGPVALPEGLEADVAAEGLSPLITPNDRFFRIDTALLIPQVDPADWSLSVTGMVERPFSLELDELLDLATTEATITLACVSNLVGGNLVGNAVWRGIPLRDLLDRSGVQDGATQIVGRSVEGFTVGFPTEVAFDGRDALVAVGMNGEPLPTRHGFPARLVVSGLYGYVSATKWLSEIELTTWEGFDAYWVPRGWSKTGPVKTQSRIDVPRGDATVEAGPRPIAGVAWAPDRGIARVEVQVDEGAWEEAELGEALSEGAWRQWILPWDATPGTHRIRVRATDGEGETQIEERRPPAPDGATGWHTIDVEVR